MVAWSELHNPYSWTIKYFDDWRCIVDYLRQNIEAKKRIKKMREEQELANLGRLYGDLMNA